jgi:hypothetical protein
MVQCLHNFVSPAAKQDIIGGIKTLQYMNTEIIHPACSIMVSFPANLTYMNMHFTMKIMHARSIGQHMQICMGHASWHNKTNFFGIRYSSLCASPVHRKIASESAF